jgi:hypothetical protein
MWISFLWKKLKKFQEKQEKSVTNSNTQIITMPTDHRLSKEASFYSIALICDFFSASPQQAVQVFALVCKRWHEVTTTQCRSMWKRHFKSNFPSVRRARDTFADFLVFADRFVVHGYQKQLLPEKAPQSYKPPYRDIEDGACGFDLQKTQEENSNNDDVINFDFVCPALASNMSRLDEVTDKNLPILFCEICKRKVFTIGSGDVEGLKNATKQGLCISLDQAATEMFELNGRLNAPNVRVNVAIVVGNDEEEKAASDMFRRFYQSEGITTFANYTGVFITKNMLEFQINHSRPRNWCLRIIRLPDNKEPCCGEPDSPLGENHSPKESGGWQFLVVFPSAKIGPGKDDTPLKALQASGRVHQLSDAEIADQSSKYPEIRLQTIWKDIIEANIINPFSYPKHVKGKVARSRAVRMTGDTILKEKPKKAGKDEDDASSSSDSDAPKKPPPKKKSSWW